MTPSISARLDDQVALVTGGNSGIGRVTARELARRGCHVFIACRSAEGAQSALTEIRAESESNLVELLPIDLGDFDSIRKAAKTFLGGGQRLNLLINNAGVAGARGLTKSGFELAFGVNHMGHFLLTQLLLERIASCAPARIITVASNAHFRAPGIDWAAVREPTRTITGLPEYGVSKLSNVLFSAELGRRLAGSGVSTYALHPGVVATNIWRNVPWPLRPLLKLTALTPEEGAATTLFCATSPSVAKETGLYYDKCQVKQPSNVAQNLVLASELWRRSEDWMR